MMLLFDNSNDDDSDSSLSSSSNSSISSAALKDGKGNPSVDFQGTKQQMMIATLPVSEEAQQLQRTTSGTTKRSTKISGFEVKESNKPLNEFESAEYISQESIASASNNEALLHQRMLAEKAKHRRWIFMPKF